MAAGFGPEFQASAPCVGSRALRWVALATLALSACSTVHSQPGAEPGAGGTGGTSRPAASAAAPSEDGGAGDGGAGGTSTAGGAGGGANDAPGVGAAAPGRIDVSREMAAARGARKQGRLAEAALGFERVIRGAPTSFDARLELVELLLLQSIDLGRAATLLDEARALRSHDAQVDRLRAWLDELNGDPAAAAADYGRVLAAGPDAELRLRRASLLMRANLVDEAIVEYEKAAAENPTDRGARTTLADIYEYRGRWADAEQMLLEIERLAPGELIPLRRLAAFYRRTGQIAKATETETRARSLVSPPRSLRPLRPSVR